MEEEQCGYLTFQTFSLEDVMRHGTPLLASVGTEFDSHLAVSLYVWVFFGGSFCDFLEFHTV